MPTINALPQSFGSLSWRMQQDRSLFNKDFKTEPAWSISSGHRASELGAFPDFNSWRALANSFGEKSLEIHLWGGVEIFYNWDTSLTTSLADSRLVILYIPFLTNYEAIELAVMEQRRRVSGFVGQVVNYIPCQPTGSMWSWCHWQPQTSNLFSFHQDGTPSPKQLN